MLEDRKEKGAFYTPREIVHYMCQQSLINYLKGIFTHSTNSGQATEVEQDIKDLVLYKKTDNNTLVDKRAREVKQALYDIKVLDPAIGSGAFPMGMLHEIVSALHSIDKSTNIAELKKQVIQNSIYGVDIEESAVEIAKLRFWLSIVVDSDTPEPLPNLFYKIMVGNSLLETINGFDPLKDVHANNSDLKRILSDIKEYFDCNDNTKKGAIKDNIQNNVIKLIREKATNRFGKNILQDKLSFDGSVLSKKEQKERDELLATQKLVQKVISDLHGNGQTTELFFYKIYFADVLDNGGFDVVIGNPPYGVSIKKESYRDSIVNEVGKVPDFEIYYFFIEKAYPLLKDKGSLSYIIPNTFLFNVYATEYRKKLLTNWGINEILDCSKFDIFESATVRNTINLWSKNNDSIYVGYRKTKNISTFYELINNKSEYIDKNNLLALNKNWGLAFMLDKCVIDLVSKINRNNNSLDKYFSDVSQGLIAYDKYRGQSDEVIKNRIYHSDKYVNGFKKWLKGADVTKYNVTWNEKHYINYCNGIANPRDPKFFTGSRILIREITNPSIYAAYTDKELYNDPAIIIIKSSNVYSIFALLCILNSKLATFYHFNSSPKATKGAFPKLLINDIREFPLPVIKEK